MIDGIGKTHFRKEHPKDLVQILIDQGLLISGDDVACDSSEECDVVQFAESGTMWLTGPESAPPLWPDGRLMTNIRDAKSVIERFSTSFGPSLAIEVSLLLSGRAVHRGFQRHGQISAGQKCRLIRSSDSWIAISLARPDDFNAIPAITGTEVGSDPWQTLIDHAQSVEGIQVVDQCQILGVAASQLPARNQRGKASSNSPFKVHRLGEAAVRVSNQPPLVIDLTSMWAGPLCANLLGRCGARIIKIESTNRPDGARLGDSELFGRLHGGHEFVSLRFDSPADVEILKRLINNADVVMESSRPRALLQLGIDAETFVSGRPGRTWISITGYGRTGSSSNAVAFGDDAAVGAGLVAWVDDDSPAFCGDAIADPIAGLFATAAGLGSLRLGGGHLIDVSLRDCAAFANSGKICAGNHAVKNISGDNWQIESDGKFFEVRRPQRVFGGSKAPSIGENTEEILEEFGISATP
jgi:hypothetical protein